MNHKLSLLILILIGVLTTANFALAWEVSWPEIPGTEFTAADKCPGGCPPSDLAEFIAYLFTFALIAAGMVALLMLILGAVQYVASAAMPSARVAARSRMTSAITGLLLLFGSYVILNTINPELVMPGLGLSGTMGPENLTMPGSTNPTNEGVELCRNYNDGDCTGCRTYNYPVENLDEGEDRNMEDRAEAFRILDNGIIVNFWEHRNFKGEVVSVEGPTGKCLKFEDVSPPDLTEKISSINIEEIGEGAILCKTDAPTSKEDGCEFFPYQTGERQQKITYKYGDGGPPVTIINPNFYNLESNAFLIQDNEARWIGVAGGFYGILCHNVAAAGTAPEQCFYLLESSHLSGYGDQGAISPEFINFLGGSQVSSLLVRPVADNFCADRNNCDHCKGVIFFTEPYYNRKDWHFGWKERAGWPIGVGDSTKGGIDPLLDTTFYNYTTVTDLGSHDEILIGIGPAYHISSFRFIGNCKMRVSDAIDVDCVAGECSEFDENEENLAEVCRPLSALCTEDFGAICPGPGVCDTGACACCDVQAGDQTCTCCTTGLDWNDTIKSFTLCNADDNADPECAGW